MTRDELLSDMRAARPKSDDVAYVERRGRDYTWRRAPLDADMSPAGAGGEARPDVWIFYSGWWPAEDADAQSWRAFLDDLLEEMEAMAGGKDRCRWPLDEPWPRRH